VEYIIVSVIIMYKNDIQKYLTIRNIKATVPYDTAIGSGYIKDLLQQYSSDNTIPVPDKYYLVIDNYINYLQNENPQPITTINKLTKCFDMASYFDDKFYFQYLMQQAFNNWATLSPTIYDERNKDIQRERDVLVYSFFTCTKRIYGHTNIL